MKYILTMNNSIITRSDDAVRSTLGNEHSKGIQMAAGVMMQQEHRI